MRGKMENIDIFNNSAQILNKNIPKSIISFKTILFLLFIFVLIFINIPFNNYKIYQGSIHIENDKTLIKLNVNELDFPINKDNKLYIEYSRYNYKIINITNDYVLLEVDLNDNIKIENNMIIVKFKSEKTKIITKIKNIIKERVNI